MPTDRSAIPIRRMGLHDEPSADPYIASLTPAERMAMVWELTKQTWAFAGVVVDDE